MLFFVVVFYFGEYQFKSFAHSFVAYFLKGFFIYSDSKTFLRYIYMGNIFSYFGFFFIIFLIVFQKNKVF